MLTKKRDILRPHLVNVVCKRPLAVMKQLFDMGDSSLADKKINPIYIVKWGIIIKSIKCLS